MKIKILSWNIWCDSYFDQVTDFLMKAGADVICLQEVSLDDPHRDVVTFLKNMGYTYATEPSVEFTDHKNTHHKLHNAVFSKFPIVEKKGHALREGKDRKIIEVAVQIEQRLLHVFSIHLKHAHQQPSDIQKAQIDTLTKILPATNTVIAGDFNAVPGSYPIEVMEQKYINTDTELQPTWSVYPEGCLVCNLQNVSIKLDHIFVSPDIRFDSYEVGSSKGSDHLPISILVDL